MIHTKKSNHMILNHSKILWEIEENVFSFCYLKVWYEIAAACKLLMYGA